MNNQQMMILRDLCVRMRTIAEAMEILNKHMETIAKQSSGSLSPVSQMFFSIDETAVYLGVSPRTVRAMIQRRLIPCVYLSKRMIRIDRVKLGKMMERFTLKSFFDGRCE